MLLTQKRLHPRDPNKFPTTQLFLLALVRAAEPIALTSILPYAWQLVLRFHVGKKSDASFYAGILISAFALAESITGMFWGALSDRIGRKPVLLMGCFGTVASLLIVGFSMNFWVALLGRFLGGALNGNIGVIQTMVGELVTNPKHEPRAYAVMPFVWSLGTIIGPCVGGYFSVPAESFPDTFASDGIFAKFPYLLPNLICAGLMMISIIAGYFCLEETHPQLQPWSRPSPRQIEHMQRMRADSSAMVTKPTDLAPGVNLLHDNYGTFNAVNEDIIEEEWKINPDGSSRSESIAGCSKQKVFTKQVIMLTIALGLFTYASMTFDHLLPIFLQDDRVPNDDLVVSLLTSSTPSYPGSLAGGLGLSVKDCGFIMAINGVIALFVQAIIFPIMAGWLGVWKVFLVVTILHPIAYFIVPFVALLPPSSLYAGIYACLTIRNCLSILAYPVLLILLKEASPSPSCLGKINGLAASTGAACRTIAAPVAGWLYGVGITMNFTAIAWWASALVAFIGAIQALMIKRDATGTQYQIRPVASCLFQAEAQESEWLRHKPSVVRIRIQEGVDSGYGTEEDERTPLRAREV